jgi:putative ABC transport system permease protein
MLKFGINSLTHRKLRSWLTVLGIVIGIASMVALISIGEGTQVQIQSRLGGLGADVITITPGYQRAGGPARGFGGFGGGGEARTNGNLTDNDVRAVKTVQGVLYVDGIVSGRADMIYLSESASVSVQGVDTSVWRFMQTTDLQSGRYLNSGDLNTVVLGGNVASGLFKNNITVNRQIIIGNRTFKVVGILQAASGFGQQDSTLFMPIQNARDVLDIKTKISSISVKVADASQVQNVADAIQSKLQIMRHVQGNKQDFTVSTSQAIQSQINSALSAFTIFLTAVAGISLLVGAIGISNTMFTSVMERTRQIGILKSLGATDGEIMKIFIAEASMIGLLGGVLGVLFGITASGIISEIGARIIPQGGSSFTIVNPMLVIFAVLFSVVVGAVAGFLPAKRAAALQPVEALRYE